MRKFYDKTSLVIGLPMTTAEYNSDNPFAAAVGHAKGRDKEGKISFVLCHQQKSFDWRVLNAKPHSFKKLSNGPLTEVCECLNQIIEIGR